VSHPFTTALGALSPARKLGYVRKIAPGRAEASGPLSAVGDLCQIGGSVLAEVAAVEADRIVLVPFDQAATILPDAPVVALARESMAPVGEAFAGRCIDAMGQAIDEGGPLDPCDFAPSAGRVLAPLQRKEPEAALETGVRAIDGLLTIGQGQRVGIFSASGVGKTTLISQLASQIECDRCIVCLVGERGREVESIWRFLSGLANARRFTCVAATSDQSAPMRVRALNQALALAEHWRESGQHVLLIVDSVTRYAMALREIGLAAGAPPTLRAYTPNVFAALPRVVERCGAAKSGGSITAFMTVLSETDDVDDPIVETMKALLDGHIVLSRTLADKGQFPAIDAMRSVSRQSERLMTPLNARAARRAVSLLSTYEEARVTIECGIYKQGANIKLDEAIALREGLLAFLRQGSGERSNLADTWSWLQSVTAKAASHA
jgi:flagellum-specific ATP synthase